MDIGDTFVRSQIPKGRQKLTHSMPEGQIKRRTSAKTCILWDYERQLLLLQKILRALIGSYQCEDTVATMIQ
jgi:hypothetical protein